MKKVLISLVFLLFMTTFVNAEEKVKVYLFEAGDCPYCEREEQYLKGLESYGTKFEIVQKELYVDHIDWALGRDYELGKKVAETFFEKGYEDASYKETPFVVISDVYAVASYDDDLATIIDNVYLEGDKDAVSCIENSAEGLELSCIRDGVDARAKIVEPESKASMVIAVIAAIAFVGAIIFVFKTKEN